MSWETVKTHLQAKGLLYSPGNIRLSDDICPLPARNDLKELMEELSDLLTEGSIRIPINQLCELRFRIGYFAIIHAFLSEFSFHLFKGASDKEKNQPWNMKKLEEIFSIEECNKIKDDGPNNWDIALLYKVIQKECWKMNGHAWMVMDQVINILKIQVHQVAHKRMCIDKAEIIIRLNYLALILNKMCTEGSKLRRVHPQDMKRMAKIIDPAISTLTSMLDKRNLNLRCDDEIPKLKKKLVIFRQNLESGLKYKLKLELHVCHLLYFSPSKLFSKFTVYEKIQSFGFDCITQEVDYNNIFEIKLKDGSTPDVYIISGPRAVGKSLYLKYIAKQSYEDPKSVPGVDQFEVIFTSQFRNEDMGSLNDLIKLKLHNTLEEMKFDASEIEDVIVQGNILIMIDGYDEVTKATQALLKELMLHGSNIKIICTTRSENVEKLIETIPPSRNYVHIIPKANSLKESCTKDEEHSFEKHFCFFDDTDNNSLDMDSDKNVSVWKNMTDWQLFSDKEPDLKELSTQVLKLCSFVERLLCAGKIIKKCKGKVDENALLIFQDLLDEFNDFQNQVEEFVQYPSDKEREDSTLYSSDGENVESSKSDHNIFENLLAKNKKMGTKEIYVPQGKIVEMVDAGLLIKNLLDCPERIIKEFKDIRYYEIKAEHTEIEPGRQMIFASMEEIAHLGSKLADFSFLIDHDNDNIGNETRKAMWRIMEEIQDLRDQCEKYNHSLPANITKKLPFTGLQYWFRKITSQYLRQDLSKHCIEMIRVVDAGDNQIRRYLLTPEKALQGPTLAEPWKTEDDIEDIEKKVNRKTNLKGKKSKSKKKKR